MSAPRIGSRWQRPNYDESKGPYNGYTVLFITNLAHLSIDHPAQVVYEGDNGHQWSLPLERWPGNLVPELTKNEKMIRPFLDKFYRIMDKKGELLDSYDQFQGDFDYMSDEDEETYKQLTVMFKNLDRLIRIMENNEN